MVLQRGIINNDELVKLFGTKKNKITYQKHGKVTNSMKNTMLGKASRYCNIVDLGRGKYEILEIYDYPKPAVLSKLKSGLYKYISPLILLKLLNGHDENNKVVFPLLDWALFIEMVNQNYKPVKYNQAEASGHLNISLTIIREFFEKVDDSIRYYMENALRYLQSANVLKWYKIPMVRKRVVERTYMENDPDIYFTCRYVDMMATDEEVNFINLLENEIDKELDIKTKMERYYGEKAGMYKEKLYTKLKMMDILYFYDGYQVFYTSLDRCKELLKEFTFRNEKTLIKDFNKAFIDLILDNAVKRQGEAAKDVVEQFMKEYRLKDNYITQFKLLSELTVDNANKRNINKELKDKQKQKIKDRTRDDFNINLITPRGDKVK